jgi:alpha-glucoside transport system permease protein
MKPFGRFRKFIGKLPVHVALIVMCLLWIIPTLGLFITSFRTREAVRTTGWWTVAAPKVQVGQTEYSQYCESCHGADGKTLAKADLTDPKVVNQFSSPASMLLMLQKPIDGKPHLGDTTLPTPARNALATLSSVQKYLQSLSKQNTINALTTSNYVDALVGYKGTATYQYDCANNTSTAKVQFKCNASDILNQAGMGSAFLNTLAVAIPATLLPIILAALAAYAFAWLDFKGRQWIFAILIGLQIVPLQMALVPIAQLYVKLHMQSTFLGIWLFHTGFGLPYAIYLMRNFIGSLPKDIFESAYLDGANHWRAFTNIVLPLSTPAIASLGIFQFLWVWNDFLIAKIFLTAHPVLTVQITNLIDPRGSNWNILTGAAFLSFIIPMIVFFAFQKYFARGLLAGSVKG